MAAHGVIEAAPDKRYVSITTLDSEMMRLGFLINIFEELFGEPIFLEFTGIRRDAKTKNPPEGGVFGGVKIL